MVSDENKKEEGAVDEVEEREEKGSDTSTDAGEKKADKEE